MATSAGRAQRRRTVTARTRRPDLSRYYGRKLPAITPGEFVFELALLRPAHKALVLDRFVESFEWSDEETAMSGNVQLRRPIASEPATVPIARGHRIRCRVRWAGRWYELWTMRCAAPEATVDAEGVSLSVDLTDDLDRVRVGRRRYLRRARKRHRHGYFGHEVVREFARKEGVRLGQLAKCRHRMPKIDVTGSFLDLVVEVYRHEREKTGRRFVVRMRNGQLEVVPYRRNRVLYVLAEEVRQATVTRTPKVEKPATVLVGKGRIGKGKDAKKIRHTEYRREMVRRFGYTRREKDYGHVESPGELRRKVRRDLARQYRVETTADVQHQGIPFIRRGDGAQLVLPSEGFSGRRSFVYCTGVRHQVKGGSYTSSFTITRTDPFVAEREARERELRAKARRRREKRRRG